MFHKAILLWRKVTSDDMARHGLILAGFGFAGGVFNYLYQLAMGRMLQPVDYGILMSLANLFLIVSVLGLAIRTVMTKYISKYHAEGNLRAIGSIWWVYLKRTLVFGTISFLVVAFACPAISGFLRIGNFWYPLTLFASLILAFAVPLNYGTLNGLQRFLTLGWTTASWTVLRLVMAILLIKLGLGVYGGLASFMFAFMVVFVITSYYLKGLPRDGDGKLAVIGLRSYVGLSFVAVLAYTVLTNIDVILVKRFLDDYQAGNYAAVAALGRAALFAPMGIALAMFPKTSGLHESGKGHRPVLIKAIMLTLVLAFGVVVVYKLFPDFFVNLLGLTADGSSKYALAAPYLFKYSLAMTFFAITFILMNYYLSLNRIKIAYVLAAMAFIQVLLIMYFHKDISQVVNVMLISSGVCMLATLLFYRWRPGRIETQEGEGI